jgi:hypothetical protein
MTVARFYYAGIRLFSILKVRSGVRLCAQDLMIFYTILLHTSFALISRVEVYYQVPGMSKQILSGYHRFENINFPW